MSGALNRFSRAVERTLTAVQFGLSGELDWPGWAISTRLGRRLPRQATGSIENLNDVDYSLAAFAEYRPLPRSEWLFHALAALPDRKRGRLLIIGPRFANERFLARGVGYRRNRVTMLDTFAYSRWVTTGDMHDMAFPDESFDDVVCGWTLAYSDAPAKAAQEMMRVLRRGGHLAVGMDTRNARGRGIEGWRDLKVLFEGLEPLARLESADNLVAVFGKGTLGCD